MYRIGGSLALIVATFFSVRPAPAQVAHTEITNWQHGANGAVSCTASQAGELAAPESGRFLRAPLPPKSNDRHSATSSDQRIDNLSFGEYRNRSSGPRDDLPISRKAQLSEDGRAHVIGAAGTLHGLASVLTCGAKCESFSESSAGKKAGHRPRPVVSPSARIDSRCSAEFSSAIDDRLVE